MGEKDRAGTVASEGESQPERKMGMFAALAWSFAGAMAGSFAADAAAADSFAAGVFVAFLGANVAASAAQAIHAGVCGEKIGRVGMWTVSLAGAFAASAAAHAGADSYAAGVFVAFLGANVGLRAGKGLPGFVGDLRREYREEKARQDAKEAQGGEEPIEREPSGKRPGRRMAKS